MEKIWVSVCWLIKDLCKKKAWSVQIFSKDIGIKFGIKKSGVLVLKIGKVVLSECVEMSAVERITEREENWYKYLGIL